MEIRRLPGDQDPSIRIVEVQEFDPKTEADGLLQDSRISELELGEFGIRFAIVAVITTAGAATKFIGRPGERRYQKQRQQELRPGIAGIAGLAFVAGEPEVLGLSSHPVAAGETAKLSLRDAPSQGDSLASEFWR